MNRIKIILLALFLFWSGFLRANSNSNDEFYNDYLYAFTEATKQELIGSLLESAQLYFKCLQYDTMDASIYYKLSNIYYSIGNYDEAVAYATKAFSLEPKNEWYQYNLFNIYNNGKRADKTIKWIEKISVKNRSYLMNRAYIEALIKNNKYSFAYKYFKKFDVEEKKLFMLNIHVMNSLGKHQEAIGLLKKVFNEDNDDTDVIGVLAETYTKMGNYERAEKYYNMLFYLEPNNSLYLMSYFDFGLISKQDSIIDFCMNELFGKSSTKLSDQLYLLDRSVAFDSIKYSEFFNQGLYRLMKDYTNWDKDAEVIFEYLAKSKFDELGYIKSLEKLNFDNPDYWQTLLFTVGFSNNDSILKYSEKAYNNFSNVPMFAWFYALSLKNRSEYYQALDVLRDFNISKIENNNLKVEFYILKGEIYERIENFEESKRNFEAALIVDPNNALLLNNYSYYLAIRSEQLEYALNMIKTCLKLESENHIYLDTYAWVLFRLKEIKRAKKVIEKAIKIGGDKNDEILDHYGDILMAMSKCEKAVKFWNLSKQYTDDEMKIRQLSEKIENCN